MCEVVHLKTQRPIVSIRYRVSQLTPLNQKTLAPKSHTIVYEGHYCVGTIRHQWTHRSTSPMQDAVLERRDRQIHRSNRHMNCVRTNTEGPRWSTLERRHLQILRPHVPNTITCFKHYQHGNLSITITSKFRKILAKNWSQRLCDILECVMF